MLHSKPAIAGFFIADEPVTRRGMPSFHCQR